MGVGGWGELGSTLSDELTNYSYHRVICTTHMQKFLLCNEKNLLCDKIATLLENLTFRKTLKASGCYSYDREVTMHLGLFQIPKPCNAL